MPKSFNLLHSKSARKVARAISLTRHLPAFGLIAVTVAGCAVPPAQQDPYAGVYGNRWIIYSDEGMDQVLVNADKTWSAHFHDRGGFDMHGVWTTKNGAICFTAPDAPASKEHCDELLGGKRVGDTWVSIDDDEQHVSVIRAGRE